MLFTKKDVRYTEVKPPEDLFDNEPVELTEATIQERLFKTCDAMEKRGLDALVIYADREHYGNFKYLTGFSPRFEEALLILHRGKEHALMLGNEMLEMGTHSRIPAKAIHTSYFSLPNQPMEKEPFGNLLRRAGIDEGLRVGVAGWKLFTNTREDERQLFDVPYYIVKAIKELTGEGGKIENGADLLIHPDYGVRVRVNANEIAYFEYGASLAASRVLYAMNRAAADMTEMELADGLEALGQPITVQTICAGEERFQNAVVEPRKKRIRLGDSVSLTLGMCGGLTARKAVMARDAEDLREADRGYLEDMVKPYFAAAATWYSSIHTGMRAGELYDLINRCIPKEIYGWTLNPGHYIGEEEWLSSPLYPDSDICLSSGAMLQMDILIHREGRKGVNAEDGIALADERLREELKREYPGTWKRMERRRAYMIRELHIPLHEEVLPLSDLAGYLRPYLLHHGRAMKVADGCSNAAEL